MTTTYTSEVEVQDLQPGDMIVLSKTDSLIGEVEEVRTGWSGIGRETRTFIKIVGRDAERILRLNPNYVAVVVDM